MPNITLGDRIAQIRAKLNYNQTDFAKALGLKSAAAISKWESNDREPELKLLKKVAELGGKNIEWLIYGKEEEGPYQKRLELLEKENQNLQKKLAVYEKAISYINKEKGK